LFRRRSVPAPAVVYIVTMSFMDKMKKAGKSVVDAGAKTMLKVRLYCCWLPSVKFARPVRG